MTNEEAKIMLLGYMYWHKKGFNQNVFSALCCALEALSEDSQPVKHGEWEQHDGCVLCEDDDTYFYTCSCCKMAITEAERGLFNYCPNCGAKMPMEADPFLAFAMSDIDTAPTIEAVPVETVCEMFGNEAPCNYGLFGVSVDDFMMSKCGKWCKDNCGKVPYTECWRKFFEAIEKGESHDKRNCKNDKVFQS